MSTYPKQNIMNNKIRLLFAVLAALVMPITLNSCFLKNQTSDNVNPNQSDSSKKTIKLKISALLPLTGPGASLGDYVKNGIVIAQEEAKEKYPNLDIDVQFIDSKNQPKEGITALQSSLNSSTPDAVISAMSSVSKAVVPFVEQKNIFTIVTTTALSDLPKGKKNVVRVYPTSEDFVEPIAKYMVQNTDNIGVLYVNDDFGKRNQEVFKALVEKSGKKITSSEPFELTNIDSRAIIGRVLATSPKSLFITGYGPSYINIFKQIREVNKTIPIYTEIDFANPSVLTALGSTAEGIIFNGTDMELSNPNTASVLDFKKKYEAKFKLPPYQMAGFSYDAVNLLIKSKLTDNRPIEKIKVISFSPVKGVMGDINLNSDGESRINLRLMKRKDGKTVVFP